MKWAVMHRRAAAYHAYVEDDSFLCTANLLHQVGVLAYDARGRG